MLSTRITLFAFALVPGGCGWLSDDDGGGYSDPMEDPEPMPDPEEPYPEAPTEEPFTGECPPQAWADSVADSNATPVSFSMLGSDIRLEAPETAEVQRLEAPGTLEVDGDGTRLVAFEDATVNGDLQGTLVVVGQSIALGEGEVAIDADASVWVHGGTTVLPGTSVDDDGARPALAVDSPAEHQLALDNSFRFDAPVTGLSLVGYDDAYLVDASGQRVDLTGPVVVSAPRLYTGWGSTFQGTVVSARWYGSFVLGLQPSSGELIGPDGAVEDLPTVVLGNDAALRIGPEFVETTEDTYVRLAMDDIGAVLPSTVELQPCEPNEIVMSTGSTRALKIAYRQTDAPTYAVFNAVYLDVDQQPGAWEPPRIELIPDVPTALSDAAENNPDTQWGQGLIDFIDAWAEVTQAVAKGLTCVFSFGLFCPGDDDGGSSSAPPSLAPYPGWMAPTAMGSFELEITAPYEPGTYDVQIHIAGDNYDTYAPLTVVVY